jgi:precorrin-3B synthase
MVSGDGLLIRVKPFGGRLTAADLRAIAGAAGTFGNGVVELTNRGNLQLRGLTADSAPHAAAALVAAGLADLDADREARRNVIAEPPWNDALVAQVEALLMATPGLPPKFCVAVGATIRRVDRLKEPSRVAEDTMRRLADIPSPAGMAEFLPDHLLIGVPFGQADAAALIRLADLLGDAILRTTALRAFHLPGHHDPAPYAAAGFITEPDDPRRSISACPGAPFCASASVSARADAARLAQRGLRGIHVSGCAKGCAHPRAAPTLVGRDGLYDLVRHGRADDPPNATGLTIEEAAALLEAA